MSAPNLNMAAGPEARDASCVVLGELAGAPAAPGADGRPRDAAIARLGLKGAALNRLVRLGLPVPPGFVITTSACRSWMAGRPPAGAQDELFRNLMEMHGRACAMLGPAAQRPLVFSVRVSPTHAIRGLLPSVLNVGLSEHLIRVPWRGTDPRLLYDCCRRLIASYAQAVCGAGGAGASFERTTAQLLQNHGAQRLTDLEPATLDQLLDLHLDIFRSATGREFPQHPMDQLFGCVGAALRSWDGPVASADRRRLGLREEPLLDGDRAGPDGPPSCGLAIVVQAMVFGNADDGSAAGRACTRNPLTGDPAPTGEFAIRVQGADLLRAKRAPLAEMKNALPSAARAIDELMAALEHRCGDVQDFQFAIESGRAFVLDSRDADRSAAAQVRLAVSLTSDGIIDPATAIGRVDGAALERLMHPCFESGGAALSAVARGNAASPGCASGRLAFSAAEALERAQEGQAIILVRRETDASDVTAMRVCAGVLTSTGGMTSHAAVEARAMGIPCVSGAEDLLIDARRQRLTLGDPGGASASRTLGPGDWISIDGARGEVYAGHVATVRPPLPADAQTLLRWADERRRLEVRANADTPGDARIARDMGAQGIGLCRTEHMFFEPDRIGAMRAMILAPDAAARREALQKLLPLQRDDFIGIFRVMHGLPVTIRLLDPPLHEFLPHDPVEQRELARVLGVPQTRLRARVEQLHEINPMLGHRGARLLVSFPEILRMQVRAIMEAACACAEAGVVVRPEIMVPLVGARGELEYCRGLVEQTAAEVMAGSTQRVTCAFGTMIEVPRAALIADELARVADFFSFGTNDLTQMTFGYSRDDSTTFLPRMIEKNILSADPFTTLDASGVGRLMEMALTAGRAVRPELKCGLCGEHGADRASVALCHRLGLDYISGSPYRIPQSRLAAGQAAV